MMWWEGRGKEEESEKRNDCQVCHLCMQSLWKAGLELEMMSGARCTYRSTSCAK